MKLFLFFTDILRFEFDIFESNLINLIILGGIIVNYIFFPSYHKFSKRKKFIKSAFIKSMKAEEKLRLALVEYYYKIFLNQTFLIVSLAVLVIELEGVSELGGTTKTREGGLLIMKIPETIAVLTAFCYRGRTAYQPLERYVPVIFSTKYNHHHHLLEFILLKDDSILTDEV